MTVSASVNHQSPGAVFAIDKDFWDNYLKGRPRAPEAFFSRIFRYHQEHNGDFGTVHDVGAGNGPYAQTLRSVFRHVIVSDLVPENVAFAKDRLGTEGFSYRVGRVEDGSDVPDGSVDMVFATNVMHFCDQELAMEVIAKQLRPGGTFACAAFGSARFKDARVQDIYMRIGQAGSRLILESVPDPSKTIAAMARTGGSYNVAPLSAKLFQPGSQRVSLNMPEGGFVSTVPPETKIEQEPLRAGAHDTILNEEESGWSFSMSLDDLKVHLDSFPFSKDVQTRLPVLWREMDDAVQDRRVEGHWPAKIILATRSSAD